MTVDLTVDQWSAEMARIGHTPRSSVSGRKKVGIGAKTPAFKGRIVNPAALPLIPFAAMAETVSWTSGTMPRDIKGILRASAIWSDAPDRTMTVRVGHGFSGNRDLPAVLTPHRRIRQCNSKRLLKIAWPPEPLRCKASAKLYQPAQRNGVNIKYRSRNHIIYPCR